MAQALSNKAASLIESDDLAGAEVLLDEAQLLTRETGSVYAMVLNHRALLMMANRTDEAALDCLDRSVKIHALLENRAKVLENLGWLESLSQKTGTDVRVTVHFINQWLAGEAVDVICR